MRAAAGRTRRLRLREGADPGGAAAPLGWSADPCVVGVPDGGAEVVVHTFAAAPGGAPRGRCAVSAVPAQAWSAAALVLLAGAVERFAGLAGTVTGAILLFLRMANGRPSYQDLALVFAVLPSAGVLVFTRFADPVAGSGPPAGGG
ncbi:monovalent cation/H+ antiporter complex subunit F [Streptomyces sp. NPDC001903]|uniref:monovalent cation/H+ antiporter complex subunit F n=1 Tax=Streptomyces sp. NPDC001903 TaxID=3364622 RepID=UPI0036BD07E7